MSFDKWTQLCDHYCNNDIERVHYPPNSLISLCINSSPHWSTFCPDWFLPVSKHHINGITEHVAFESGFFCYIVLSWLIYASARISSPVRLYCWVVFHCVDVPQFCLSIYQPMGCFFVSSFLAIMNVAAINIGTQVFLWMCVFISLQTNKFNPRSKTSWCHSKCMFNFVRNCPSVFQRDCTICIADL